jgi:hypothetical protein
MNGDSFNRVTSVPMRKPHATPPQTPPSAAAAGGKFLASNCAIMTVHSAIAEPTDKSMPPAAMTEGHAERRHRNNGGLQQNDLCVIARQKRRRTQRPDQSHDKQQA